MISFPSRFEDPSLRLAPFQYQEGDQTHLFDSPEFIRSRVLGVLPQPPIVNEQARRYERQSLADSLQIAHQACENMVQRGNAPQGIFNLLRRALRSNLSDEKLVEKLRETTPVLFNWVMENFHTVRWQVLEYGFAARYPENAVERVQEVFSLLPLALIHERPLSAIAVCALARLYATRNPSPHLVNVLCEDRGFLAAVNAIPCAQLGEQAELFFERDCCEIRETALEFLTNLYCSAIAQSPDSLIIRDFEPSIEKLILISDLPNQRPFNGGSWQSVQTFFDQMPQNPFPQETELLQKKLHSWLGVLQDLQQTLSFNQEPLRSRLLFLAKHGTQDDGTPLFPNCNSSLEILFEQLDYCRNQGFDCQKAIDAIETCLSRLRRY